MDRTKCLDNYGTEAEQVVAGVRLPQTSKQFREGIFVCRFHTAGSLGFTFSATRAVTGCQPMIKTVHDRVSLTEVDKHDSSAPWIQTEVMAARMSYGDIGFVSTDLRNTAVSPAKLVGTEPPVAS